MKRRMPIADSLGSLTLARRDKALRGRLDNRVQIDADLRGERPPQAAGKWRDLTPSEIEQRYQAALAAIRHKRRTEAA